MKLRGFTVPNILVKLLLIFLKERNGRKAVPVRSDTQPYWHCVLILGFLFLLYLQYNVGLRICSLCIAVNKIKFPSIGPDLTIMSWKHLGKKTLSGLWSVALYMISSSVLALIMNYLEMFLLCFRWPAFGLLYSILTRFFHIFCFTGNIIFLILFLIEWQRTDHSLMVHQFLSLTEILTQCHQTAGFR